MIENKLNNNKTKITALKFAKFKELIHPALLKVISSKTTGELFVRGNLPETGNCLIVANHVCIEDVPTLGQAVNKHIYLLVSDEDKLTIDGLGLELNGVQWVSRLNKESRRTASENAINILKQGNTFAMYPESTWNLSPNHLIMPMNYGCIKIALSANVPIVPVVSFFTGQERYTKIGEPFYPTTNLEESIDTLRDIMATMVYEEIEEYYRRNLEKNENIFCITDNNKKSYYESRKNIPNNYWQEYVLEKYEAYKRASNDKDGVREFESQFIFTPKTDEYTYFQLFNSIITSTTNGILVSRISSEKNGYNGPTFGEGEQKNHFGYGYNEKVLKKQLKK